MSDAPTETPLDVWMSRVEVVPREPSEEMLIAARDWSIKKYGTPIGDDAARGCWKAMLDAAWSAPAEPP